MLKKYRFPLHLQMFNDDEEIEFEIEDDEEVELDDEEVQESDGDQGADSNEYEESDFDDQDEFEEPQREVKKNETASAVIAERKKWQAKLKQMEQEAEVSRRLMQQMGIKDISELNRQMDLLESQRLQQNGVPAEMADRIARTERELKEQQREIRAQKYSLEAERLRSDPFYADLDDHLDELMNMADRNGISLKSAYLAEHGERRMKERESEIEAKVKANKQKRAAKKVDTSPTGSGKTTQRINLTADEKAVAKAAGLTFEEYAKYKK